MTVTAHEVFLEAEKSAAAGETIDWDELQAAVEAAVAAGLEAEEIEASIAKMPEDLVKLRNEKLRIDAKMETLKERKEEIKDTFRQRLLDEDLDGFTIRGKVRARVTHGTRTGVDSNRLKEERPGIWKRFLKTTSYTSCTIS